MNRRGFLAALAALATTALAAKETVKCNIYRYPAGLQKRKGMELKIPFKDELVEEVGRNLSLKLDREVLEAFAKPMVKVKRRDTGKWISTEPSTFIIKGKA